MSSSSLNQSAPVKPVIFGMKCDTLRQDELHFFDSHNPLGFILFKRNIQSRHQVRDLCRNLRQVVGREDALIMIDQEGGRVCRIRPPHFRECPPMLHFAQMAKEQSLTKAKTALYEHSLAMGYDLKELGINMNAAPVVDLCFENTHSVIGDRSFGSDPEFVAEMALEVIRAYKKAGVVPIIKHIPGHGRAQADSHHCLPVVDEILENLEKTDFRVFKILREEPIAMTAHIEYKFLDTLPATISHKIIKYIRQEIGFKGILLTDDLSMHALRGSFTEKTKNSLEAGCEILLHCNGLMSEMKEIAENSGYINNELSKKIEELNKIAN